MNNNDFQSLKVDSIVVSGGNPRKSFNVDDADFLALVESIKKHGIIQPLTVNLSNSEFSLISGERRLLAAKKASLEYVPCYIKYRETEDSVVQKRVIENTVRVGLTSIELAMDIKKYIKRHPEMKQQQVASEYCISSTQISKILKLLKLPEAVWGLIINRKLSDGHAESLLPLIGKVITQQITAIAHEAVENSLTVAELRAIVKETLSQKDEDLSAKIKSSGEGLTVRYGEKATIKTKGDNAVITFTVPFDELDDTLALMGIVSDSGLTDTEGLSDVLSETAYADISSTDEQVDAENEYDSGEIEPEVLAMQRALMGDDKEADISDPSYFDIDALLAKGSTTANLMIEKRVTLE